MPTDTEAGNERSMELPVIDLEPYLRCSGRLAKPGDDAVASFPSHQEKLLCQKVAASFRDMGALIIRDPRCLAHDNDRFLDMMEEFFEKSDEFKRKQERPFLHYQVGVTPGGVEVPRSAFDQEMCRKASLLAEDSRPLIPTGPDRKWRYMWRIGPRPAHTRFKELNAERVIPEGFPEWVDVMNGWGSKMIAAVEVVAEMAAIGFDLPPDTFTSLMFQGPNLLAPTGSDLAKDGKEGTILAGYHYDLNFLTIHGRSRFPGLFIWIKSGQKLEVSVPPGCLLLQTGKQFEWLTGGTCPAGMHEVVVSKRTVDVVQAAAEAKRSLWRVSSTVFGHIASDAILQPLGHFANAPDAHKYPPICAGDYVEAELSEINLKGK